MNGLLDELQWVHGMLRRDLATVRRLADEAAAGTPAAEVRAGLTALATNGPLWQLKLNCLRYCRFVHGHHHLESAALFPELRRANPALNPVIDKLEAEHARVADLVDAVEAAARSLDGDDRVRRRLVEALRHLADDLLTHLQYEEEQLSDTLRRWPWR